MLALAQIFSIHETPEWSRTTGEITMASTDVGMSRHFVSFGRTVPLRRATADEEVKSSGDSDRTPHASPEQGRSLAACADCKEAELLQQPPAPPKYPNSPPHPSPLKFPMVQRGSGLAWHERRSREPTPSGPLRTLFSTDVLGHDQRL